MGVHNYFFSIDIDGNIKAADLIPEFCMKINEKLGQ